MIQSLRMEQGFYRRLWRLSLPIILQNLITTSLGFADTFMVGLLGNAEMAAVTAANTPIFIIQIAIFGFQSGMAVLVSQYWGRGDTDNINRCMGVALYAATGFAALVAGACFFFPEGVMRLITDNEALVALAADYIRIVGISYIFNAVSSVYVGVQRSTEFPAFGMILFGISMAVNTFLNFVLIFGKFGAPALGVTGAAIATLTSRVVEFACAVLFALFSRRLPLRPKYILAPGMDTVRRFIKYATPVVCNETLWSTGTSMLTVIMGHMASSQDMLAAHALIGNVARLSEVASFGIAASTALIVGKEIGMGQSRDRVYRVSGTLLRVSALTGAAVTAVLLVLIPAFFQPVLFPLFKLSPGAAEAATYMAVIFAVFMPVTAFDVTNVTGVLRSGGDTKVAAIIDIAPLWLFAIPAMTITALVLESPVWVVCIAMRGENFLKCPLGLTRFRSRKWINDITRIEA